MRMRISILALALALSLIAFVATPALAAGSAKKPMSAQQSKMAECSHQSKGMKGDAHKQFMSDCLKGKSGASASAAATPAAAAVAAAPTAASGGKMSQQDKMKSCSADAKSKGLKGANRKSFMSTCLKG